MRLNPDQWREIRTAVDFGDQPRFERLVQEFCRIFVACERSHARICDSVRDRERGRQPYLCSERTHQ